MDLKKLYVKRRPEDSKVIHVLSSGLKAVFSWHNMRTLQVGLSILLSICAHASLCTFVLTLVFWEVAIQPQTFTVQTSVFLENFLMVGQCHDDTFL